MKKRKLKKMLIGACLGIILGIILGYVGSKLSLQDKKSILQRKKGCAFVTTSKLQMCSKERLGLSP